ncbi:MAG: aminotransferase class V-fold PLP-dependent enzyme [Eubacteriaceae bacterium]|jgi:glutamate/tyrosine decarboxylase-like PLP-dependent enzyme|nr:aminotransferase class V-fold PLP-dependent enzyme [Eubacteriaceae bacterium]
MEKEKYLSPVLETLRHYPLQAGIEKAAGYAAEYAAGIGARPVYPHGEALAELEQLGGEVPEQPAATDEIIDILGHAGSDAAVSSTGGSYFGFVMGGSIPAGMCAGVLSSAWDQNAAKYAMSPVANELEGICEKWVTDILGLPAGTAMATVGGSSNATMIAITAARDALLARKGYDAGRDGLFGAPEIRAVIGAGAHPSVYRALSVIGLGSGRVEEVPCRPDGSMSADDLPELDDMTLLILQAGALHTGAFDEIRPICEKAGRAGAWVHIDGAVGLWAAASENLRHLTDGLELADSWAADAHKGLNAPYDCGIVLCRDRSALTASMGGADLSKIDVSAGTSRRDNMDYTYEMSRRARSVELWAVIKSLGREGIGQMQDELHAKAVYFAERLAGAGFEIMNDVTFIQFGAHWQDDETTAKVLKTVQDSGVCWMGGAEYKGKFCIRICVCSWRTTYEDIDVSADEIIRAAQKPR